MMRSRINFGTVALDDSHTQPVGRDWAAAAAEASSTRTEVVDRSLADEASLLAAQLQQLAAKATAAVGSRAVPPPDVKSVGVGTEVSLDELREWQAAPSLLSAAREDIDHARSEAATSRTRALHAAESRRAAEAESQLQKEQLEAAEAEVPRLAAANAAEAAARETALAELRAGAAEAEARASSLRAEGDQRSEEVAEATRLLEQEISAAKQRREAATSEAKSLSCGTQELAASGAAEKILEAAEEAEARGTEFEEERAQLEEEMGNLRFSLKETKRFQHKRVQDLEQQVQKLERQRKKLEAEQAARARSAAPPAEASKGLSVADQLLRVREMTGKLKEQLAEGEQEQSSNRGLSELQAERERCRLVEAAAQQKVSATLESMDEMAESEGSLKRDARELRNRAALLQKQVAILDATASQTSLQLQEAEASHTRMREEEQATERRAEIIGWKLQVAETQLNTRPSYRQRGRSGSSGVGAAATAGSSSSSSPAGTGGPASGSLGAAGSVEQLQGSGTGDSSGGAAANSQ
eukprot:gb/GFBE01055353.1/.p1 GENE.gb/GFBE01055353.1/~~gb/GFBE01055353.1/.p1  ORF type:complete len:527 (+),score=157.24 gb/GFBE01055353.1/:1-1581(+)